MDHQLAKVHTLSRQGDWDQVLPLLRAQPALVNAATEPKGYTALHQAAWHGASLEVVGELLALGADRGLLTVNKRQTAAKIAQEKHPDRRDLVFLLGDSPRTMAQLMRKMLADDPTLFPHYDANRLVFDLVVEAFGADLFGNGDDCLDERLGAAFHAALGTPPVPGATFGVECGFVFDTQCESDLWTGRITQRLLEFVDVATCVPLQRDWTVIGDLFDPLPAFPGARGDPFLWFEMQQSLARIPLPEDTTLLRRALGASFFVHTGLEVSSDQPLFVQRFDRGGMSSGFVSPESWRKDLIPLLLQRAGWLRQSWSWDRR